MVLESIIVGLVSNGLYSLFQQAAVRISGPDQIKDLLSGPGVAELASKVGDVLSRHLSGTDAQLVDEVGRFLRSGDVHSIVSRLFLTTDDDESLESLRQTFVMLLGRAAPSAGAEPEFGNQLFGYLVAVASKALDQQIEAGVLSAHELQGKLRHKAVMNELSSVKATLRLLQDDVLDLPALHRALGVLAKSAVVRHGFITPPHIDLAPRIPIDRVYVAPAFEHEGPGNSIALSTFEAAISRTVVLGNPGAGKSTLSQKIVFDLANTMKAAAGDNAGADAPAAFAPIPRTFTRRGAPLWATAARRKRSPAQPRWRAAPSAGSRPSWGSDSP